MIGITKSATTHAVNPIAFIVLTIALTSVTYGFGRYAFGLFLPSLRAEFAASTMQLGMIASANAATYLISTVLASTYAIYFRPTYMMSSACLITVIGLSIAGLAGDFKLVAFGIVFAGIGGGILSPALFEAIEHWLPEQWKVRAIAAVSAGATPGMVVTAIVAYSVPDTWRIAWIMMAMVGIFVLAIAFMKLPSDRLLSTTNGPKMPLSISLFLRPENYRLYFSLLIYGILFSIYITFSVDILSNRENLPDNKDQLFWALLGLSGLPAILNGLLISAFSLRNFIRFVFFMCAVSYALLALFSDQFTLVLISAVLFGYTSIAIGSGLLVWSISIYKERPSIGSGVVFFLFSVTTIIGPTLFSVGEMLFSSAGVFIGLSLLSLLPLLTVPDREY